MAPERPNAPYAPLANVLTVIRRLRERGIPQPVTRETLTLLGIPDGNAPRTLQALRFLGLVVDDGVLSPAAERLRRATTDEYPGQLAEILQEAYAPVFELVDPATATEVRISDAFRQYEPAPQRDRMVTLFLGLCAEAEIAPPQRAPRAGRESSSPRKPLRPIGRAARPSAQTINPAGIPSAAVVGAAQVQTSPTTIFPVLEEDLALLDDQQFAALWDALGTVARARAKANTERANRRAPDLFAGFWNPTKASTEDAPQDE